jgi:hypothetical protein
MSSSTKIAYSRLLYADFISDENEEIEIIKKINGFGFTTPAHEGNTPTKFSVGDIDNFVGQLRSACTSDSKLLDYVKNVAFWIYSDGILPLKVAIIEVVLKTDDLQKLKKIRFGEQNMETFTSSWKLLQRRFYSSYGFF